MRRLLAFVERVARVNAAILITGESGTGKELIARAIHHYSMRCARPWIDLNCAALPELLIESELFGYEKGAFSGALATKPGMFELAQTGSVFLDEIGDLPPRMQVKLLRVLDGAPYYRLGGTRKISVDARVIAATNQDLD
jgi:transcriptional regulator with GAF, ATPase, and Fis domain